MESTPRYSEEQLTANLAPVERLRLMNILAYRLIGEQDWQRGRKYAEAALEMARELNERTDEARALHSLGLLNDNLNRYDHALEYHLQALRILEDVGDEQRQADILNAIGQIYGKMKDFDHALDYFQRALQLYPRHRASLNNLAMVYTIRQNYTAAIDAYQRAIDESADNPEMQIGLLTNQSVPYRLMNDYDRAWDILQHALQLTRGDDTPNTGYIYDNLGELLHQQKRYAEAAEYLEKSKAIALKFKNQQGYQSARHSLYQVYEAIGEYRKAFENCRDYSDDRDRHIDDTLLSRMAEITAIHEVEKRELETRQLIEKTSRLSSIGVMTAGIVHEINQPLCTIKVNSDAFLYYLRKNNVELPQHLHENLLQISTASGRIDSIIQHIRSFWIPSAQAPDSNIDLIHTVRQALTLVERQACSHGVTLETEFANDWQHIVAETVPIEEIVINLVVNAIQALDEVERRDKTIHISVTPAENVVMLRIRDNGPGIAPDDISRLFDPFFSKKRVDTGMGLGLAIVKSYVERFHATIAAMNNPGDGACFEIRFPMPEDTEEPCES